MAITLFLWKERVGTNNKLNQSDLSFYTFPIQYQARRH